MEFTPLTSHFDAAEATAASPRRKSLAGRCARASPAPAQTLTLPAMAHYVTGRLVSGEASLHSPQTLAIRRTITDNLL